MPATISGTAFDDANTNGVQDGGESGVAGVGVTITPSSGSPINTTTDGTGYYAATGLSPGSYTVSFTPPAGYTVDAPSGGSTTVDIEAESDEVGVGCGLADGGTGSGSGTPVISMAPEDTAENSPESGGVQFTRSDADTSAALTVAYTVGGTATPGTDYTTLSGSVTFLAGEDIAFVPVAALPDNVVEQGGETVTLTIAATAAYTLAGGAGSATATVTIADDPPVISITSTNVTEGETASVVLTRTGGNINAALGVAYTVGGTATPGLPGTPGADYITLDESVTFDAHASTAVVDIAAYRDNVVEPDGETVTLTMTPTGTYTLAGGASWSMAVVTILDDPPIVWVDPASQEVTEGESGSISVLRSGGDISQPLTVGVGIGADGAGDPLATWGDDYILTAVGGGTGFFVSDGGTVTFDANSTAVSLQVLTFKDDVPDGGEGFRVTVEADANDPATYLAGEGTGSGEGSGSGSGSSSGSGSTTGGSTTADVKFTEVPKITLTDLPYVPINANRDDMSPWKYVGEQPLEGIPLLRDMDIAPSRDIGGWDGIGPLPDGPAITDPDLKKMTAKLTSGALTGEIKVQVSYADGVVGGRINLWSDESKTAAVLSNAGGLSTGGTAILPGYPTADFYVEGISPSQSVNDITIKVSVVQGGVTYSQEKQLTVTPVVNGFSVKPKDPASATFVKNDDGNIFGITSGDYSTRTPGVTYSADCSVESLLPVGSSNEV